MIKIPRKFVQLVHSGELLYAVADDGTAWYRYEAVWKRLEDLPDRVVQTPKHGDEPWPT